VERWPEFFRDGAYLFPMNYQELALNKDKVSLEVNAELFSEIDQKEVLNIVTVRDDGKLVGYHVSALLPHMHYKGAGLMGYTDVYFLRPDYRRAGTGIRLLRKVETSLAERNVPKLYMSTKVHSDNGPLLEAMGYTFSDRIFTKVLEK
jgi:L-amino acid N-acyltransferase YncA